ncbi:MAG: mannosyltransferase family protein [Chloroflexota bacterium]
MVIFKSYPWWVQCTSLWLCVFVFLNLAGLVGARFLDHDHAHHACEPNHVPVDEVPGIWRRWDACYYLGLAGGGYVERPGSAGFFPLYPLFIGFIHRLSGATLEFSAFVVSSTASLLSVLVFYKLGRTIKDDHTFAMRSVLALLIFPTSFYFFAIYAESLYLLFALLGTYLILRKNSSLIGGGLALGVSSIARPVGWLIDIVMLGEFVRKRRFDVKGVLALGLGLVFSILGMILFVYYLYLVLGTFTAIPEAQSHWPRQWQLPWITYLEGLKTLATTSLLRHDWFLYAMNALDLFSTSCALVIILISFRWAQRMEFPWSLSAYSLVTLLFFLSSQNELPVPLWGMTRWVGSLFPMYFVLGNLFKNQKVQALYFVGSAMVLIFFTIWWTSGRWIG